MPDEAVHEDTTTPDDGEPDTGRLFTIKDVAAASGLPQPAAAQVVPRTWTPKGWMYTAAQVRYAAEVGQTMRSQRATPSPPAIKGAEPTDINQRARRQTE
ncbi:MAG TPA: hypothetical protein VF874_17045 [Mycobacterium sp.]